MPASRKMALWLSFQAGCAGTEADRGEDTAPPGAPEDLLGYVRLLRAGPDPSEGDAYIGASASFTTVARDQVWADGECTTEYWYANDRTEQLSAGIVEFLLDGAVVEGELGLWPEGAIFGARASGDVFPAFEVVEAVTVPAGLDVVLPDSIPPDADLTLRWSPPYSDRVTVWFSRASTVDSGTTLWCEFADDGEAELLAAAFGDLVADANRGPGISFGVTRWSESATNVDEADLLFAAGWQTWKEWATC